MGAVRNESLVAAVDSPEPSLTLWARPSDKSDRVDLWGVRRLKGDLTGTGGLGLEISRGGRGGASGLMVRPGDLRSGRGDVCGVTDLVGG